MVVWIVTSSLFHNLILSLILPFFVNSSKTMVYLDSLRIDGSPQYCPEINVICVSMQGWSVLFNLQVDNWSFFSVLFLCFKIYEFKRCFIAKAAGESNLWLSPSACQCWNLSLGPQLFSRIWVHVMVGLLKKLWLICQSGWREIQNTLPVICWVCWGPRAVCWGARDGAVVRALASHQSGPGSNPGIDDICGLSLLLVLSFSYYSKRFFSGYSGFSPSSKTNISKFQFNQESGGRRTTLWMCYLQIIIYLFIYLEQGSQHCFAEVSSLG